VDGNPPTKASPVYTHPLTSLPSGAVVRAMATAEGHTPSSDVTGVYVWSGTARPPANPLGSNAYNQGKSSYDHKQYSQARTLFAESCDGGEMSACNYLGFLYAQGLGGPRNEQTARDIYMKACEQGSSRSCDSLGSLYEDSDNNDEARKYFQKACTGGLAEGCEDLRGVK
jgi:TPR repeat protein